MKGQKQHWLMFNFLRPWRLWQTIRTRLNFGESSAVNTSEMLSSLLSAEETSSWS
jgi:hypothetical protein